MYDITDKKGKENFVRIPFSKRNWRILSREFIHRAFRTWVTGKTAPCRGWGRVRKCWRERERRPVNRVIFFFFSTLFFLPWSRRQRQREAEGKSVAAVGRRGREQFEPGRLHCWNVWPRHEWTNRPNEGTASPLCACSYVRGLAYIRVDHHPRALVRRWGAHTRRCARDGERARKANAREEEADKKRRMYIRDMAARWKRTKGWKRDGEKEVERERVVFSRGG